MRKKAWIEAWEAAQSRALKAELARDEAVALLRGIVEDDCGKLRARHFLSLLDNPRGVEDA